VKGAEFAGGRVEQGEPEGGDENATTGTVRHAADSIVRDADS
jgi:hypothetical protein